MTLPDLVRVPLTALLDLADPFDTPPWGIAPFTVTDVHLAALTSQYAPAPDPARTDRGYHLARIAWLHAHGWNPEDEPPHLDVGFPGTGPGHWPLTDGNHRYCAAVARGDTHLDLQISGSLDHAEELLGIRIP